MWKCGHPPELTEFNQATQHLPTRTFAGSPHHSPNLNRLCAPALPLPGFESGGRGGGMGTPLVRGPAATRERLDHSHDRLTNLHRLSFPCLHDRHQVLLTGLSRYLSGRKCAVAVTLGITTSVGERKYPNSSRSPSDLLGSFPSTSLLPNLYRNTVEIPRNTL